MQNTFSSLISKWAGGNQASQSPALFPTIDLNQKYNKPIEALIRRSNRVNVEFTKDAWKQFVSLKGNIFTALIQVITVKADMALYITAHAEKGIALDNICQEVCYEQGVFFLMKNVRGTWYITEVFTTDAATDYTPVFFWTRIKRGCDVLTARVLLCWRRLTGKAVGTSID